MSIMLRPCPWCGEEPADIVDATKILGVHRIVHRCKVLPPFSLEAATPEQVAAIWNHRHGDEDDNLPRALKDIGGNHADS